VIGKPSFWPATRCSGAFLCDMLHLRPGLVVCKIAAKQKDREICVCCGSTSNITPLKGVIGARRGFMKYGD
jgi:hypothetical protein